MRFLKKKIALSALSKAQESLPTSPTVLTKVEVKEEYQEQSFVAMVKPKESVRGRKRATDKSKEDTKATKTIVKNYGKAIASFAASKVALPYLTPILDQENVKLAEFVEYISKAKETIEGIDTFRNLLLVKENDNKKLVAFKTVFQNIAETFIKYFSVNWIFSGRMMNKKVHLMFRFKMLRRIQNPELFTYLK